MIKLYKRTTAGQLDYHEAWMDGDEIVEHWGRVGDRGEQRTHAPVPGSTADAAIERVLASARANGFAPLRNGDLRWLLVEYPVDGMGTSVDLQKRHALEDRLNETLGWTGLGHCDGGSIGSGSMEAACLVVDFETARAVIEADLEGTEFADISRIYDQGALKEDE